MPLDDDTLGVNDDRLIEAKAGDTRRDLRNLIVGCLRIAGVGRQAVRMTPFDVQYSVPHPKFTTATDRPPFAAPAAPRLAQPCHAPPSRASPASPKPDHTPTKRAWPRRPCRASPNLATPSLAGTGLAGLAMPTTAE